MTANDHRIALLEKKHLTGLSLAEERRLMALSERVAHQLPRVTEADFDRLRAMEARSEKARRTIADVDVLLMELASP